MENPTLESVFIAYLQYRCYHPNEDIPDGEGNLAVEYDNPLVHPYFEDQFLPGGGQPPVPAQFPFLASQTDQQSINIARKLFDCAAEYSSTHPEKSIIRFKDFCVVKEPREHIISIPVIRLENFKDKVTRVTWNTRDKTALSGIHYVGQSGDIIFDEGEIEKSIEIRILNPTNANANTIDLRFLVELTHHGGLFNPTPLTVSLKKTSVFEDAETQVLNDLPSFHPFNIDEIKFILDGHLTSRTFHVALTHLCSSTADVHVQYALACELGAMCYKTLRSESISKILKDYFRNDEANIV